MRMGAKNISISDEAYTRLASMKTDNESFTDVINRLTGKRSILELAGTLTGEECSELSDAVKGLRAKSRDRVSSVSRRMNVD
jgi:predicted CopG family antitoxin